MATQLVTAKLQDLVSINEAVSPESLILELKTKDIKSANIHKTLKKVAPYIAAVHIKGDTLQKYVFMKDSEKSDILSSLIVLNTVGEEDERKIGVVVDMTQRLPEWEVAEQHVNAMLEKFENSFPFLQFWIINPGEDKLSNRDFFNVTFDYLWENFSGRDNVKLFVNTTTCGNAVKTFKIAERNKDIIAISGDKEDISVWSSRTKADYYINGVTVEDIVSKDRRTSAQRGKVTKQLNEVLANF